MAWHGFWGFWLKAGVACPSAAVPAVSEMSYAPVQIGGATDGVPPADLRVLWSPVLFALPTPMGFSRTALTNDVGARPPLTPPGDTAVFLDRAAPTQARVAQMGQNMEELVFQSSTSLPLRVSEEPVFGDKPAPTGETIQIEFAGDLAGRTFSRFGLPEDPRVRGENAWEAGAYVEIGPDGRVRHVLLEEPSPSAKLNAMLVRAILGWQMDGPGGAVGGRVTLRHPGAALNAPSVEKKAVP
jgi:hypothetical protein